MITFNQVAIGKKYLFDGFLVVKADEYIDNHIGKTGAIYDQARQTYFTLDRLSIYSKNNLTTRRYFKQGGRCKTGFARKYLKYLRATISYMLKRKFNTL